MIEHGARGQAGHRLVVIDEAGGEERRLALAEGRRVGVRRNRRAAVRCDESAADEFGQFRMRIDAERFLHQRPRQAVVLIRRPIRHRRQATHQRSVAVHLRQLPRGEAGLAVARLHHAVAQEKMGKVHLPGMRRHVRTFGHEAHVAKRAGFGDLGEILGLYAFDVFGRIVVDQLEQTREGIAKIEAAPAAMTDLEDPAHLGLEPGRIVKFLALPCDRMAGRSFQAAFTGHIGQINPVS